MSNAKIAGVVVGVAGLGFAIWWWMRPRAVTVPAPVPVQQAFDPGAKDRAIRAYEGVRSNAALNLR